MSDTIVSLPRRPVVGEEIVTERRTGATCFVCGSNNLPARLENETVLEMIGGPASGRRAVFYKTNLAEGEEKIEKNFLVFLGSGQCTLVAELSPGQRWRVVAPLPLPMAGEMPLLHFGH